MFPIELSNSLGCYRFGLSVKRPRDLETLERLRHPGRPGQGVTETSERIREVQRESDETDDLHVQGKFMCEKRERQRSGERKSLLRWRRTQSTVGVFFIRVSVDDSGKERDSWLRHGLYRGTSFTPNLTQTFDRFKFINFFTLTLSS